MSPGISKKKKKTSFHPNCFLWINVTAKWVMDSTGKWEWVITVGKTYGFKRGLI